MSVKCYNAPPDPSYYSSGYYPDEVPPYSYDDAPPYEPEPTYRDYPEYLRNTYLSRPNDEMWEDEATAPELRVLPTRYQFPWRRRQPEYSEPEYTPINPAGRAEDDDYAVRPVAAHVAQELKDLCILFGRHSSAEIDDCIEQMGAAFRMLKRMVKQQRKATRTPKVQPGQLSLV